MGSTRTKVEIIKPVFLKAGIPLVISVAGFIIARITSRKKPILKSSSSQTQVNFQESNPNDVCRDEEEEHIFINTLYKNSQESLQIQERCEIEEEIVGLRNRINDLQEREWELETRFLRYHELKEQELVLKEIQSNLLLEIERAEFLGREISSMEAENKRFEEMVVEFMKILKQLESSRLENRLLQRRVRNLFKKIKLHFRIINKKNLQIEANDAEITRHHEELERRSENIKGLENENMELKISNGQLEEDKNDLINKLELAEKSVSSKIEAEGKRIEDYNQLVNEVEQLQKERAAEINELIYLRWSNACLRHKLMWKNKEEEEVEKLEGNTKNQIELDFGGSGETDGFGSEDSSLDHGESCLGFTNGGRAHSKRQRLIEKFKRWVEGSEKIKQKLDERAKVDVKCFGSNSVSDAAEEKQLPARKSCSSA